MAVPNRRIKAKKQFQIRHKEIKVEKKEKDPGDVKNLYALIEKQREKVKNGIK